MRLTPKALLSFIFTYTQLTIGSFIGAVAVILFLAPFDIAPSGVSGVAVILNRLINSPIGIVVFVLNIPIQIFAYWMLPSGWRIVVRTIFAIVIFTFCLDVLVPYLPREGVTGDQLLNAIFGGVLGGIGHGIVLRAGGTLGGTSTLAQIIHKRTGLPLNSIYVYTDTAVLAWAGLVFGWQAALYAVVALFVDGLAANYVLEGPSMIRIVTIITNHPQEVYRAIYAKLGRGATQWEGKGMYTGEARHVMFVTITRSQVELLRHTIHEVDPQAFVVIGQGHTAYGEGFQSAKRHLPMDT